MVEGSGSGTTTPPSEEERNRVEAEARAAAEAAQALAGETLTAVETLNDGSDADEEYSLMPGDFSEKPLDYKSAGDAKLYKQAIAKLGSEFGLDAGKLHLFLSDLNNRGNSHGWDSILTIPTANGKKNLLKQYGQVTLADAKADAALYLSKTKVTKKGQLQMQLYNCLYASLTEQARERLTLRMSDYTVNTVTCGTMFLKVIIAETYMDTNATTKFIRDNLSNLDKYIVDVESDIQKFNQYVQLQLDNLAARGEGTSDLLINLFKAYKCASDSKFVRYIEDKEVSYEEGKPIEPKELMRLALLRYNSAKTNKSWNAPSEAEEKIIALAANLAKAKKEAAAGKGKKGDQKKKGAKKKKSKKDLPDWVETEPKEGEPKKKDWKGKPMHWCPKHKAWTRHTPEQCEGIAFKPESKKKKDDGDDADKKKTKAVGIRMQEALAAVVEEA